MIAVRLTGRVAVCRQLEQLDLSDFLGENDLLATSPAPVSPPLAEALVSPVHSPPGFLPSPSPPAASLPSPNPQQQQQLHQLQQLQQAHHQQQQLLQHQEQQQQVQQPPQQQEQPPPRASRGEQSVARRTDAASPFTPRQSCGA